MPCRPLTDTAAQTESRAFYDCCLKMIATYARHQSSLRAAAADSTAEEDSFSDLLLLMELLTNMLTKDIIDLGTPPAQSRNAVRSKERLIDTVLL